MPLSFDELQQKAQKEWEAFQRAAPSTRILVGTATCGRAAGAQNVVEAFRKALAQEGIHALIHEVGCLGPCYAEPIVDIIKAGHPRITYGNITPEIVPQLVRDYLINDNPRADMALGIHGDGKIDGIPNLFEIPFFKLQMRIALRNSGIIDPINIYHYIANGGYSGLKKALEMTSEQVVAEVQKSGLRGRGGAAFPTGQKWQFLLGAPGPTKYILCNCEEGDPGAFNDKAILESDPHTLLEGMVIAGYATKATNGYVFIRYEHREVIRRTQMAINQMREFGLLGSNILGTSFGFDISIALTGESYVSGEETALMEAIEGKRAMPRPRPPFPAQVGLWRKPSNINNVKTLSYVPEILRRGGEWYAGIGTERSKGTAIVCLSGNINRPGLAEVPMGTSLKSAIEEIGGGAPNGKQIKLLQTGGPLGGIISASQIEVPLDFDAMAGKGAILGSGGIIVADERTCVVELLKILCTFIYEESCGKCFPCRIGTAHILDLVKDITEGRGRPGDTERLLAMGETLTSSLCGHGQLTISPIRSAINYFGDEFKAHIEEKRCPAGVCKALGRQG
ncbi:MAG: SLBB domain-containing protein [Chloroflexi bacterium]|nr:SLBB domain-containing protein [Chloroflexota bacterium]